ncbi:winged helix DNA-binding protein [Altererythrobacter lutimaris]|uniref:Winged helix DNA-binding protein n=1 Tax=Altererythrobacter lutimaris TaxID=2743979 RepID=A0A850HCY3_9SPHN|nr:winged helix DNA-binding protein [Altererythrobacter lutimaris]NVE94931.1 winged helix DNA-binding protein [Altererythrobacter lutimaris]
MAYISDISEHELIDAVGRLNDLLANVSVQADTTIDRSNRPVVDQVKRDIVSRTQREEYFPSEMFAEPAWDMLLDLYVANEAGIDISVTSLCIASNAPATTALRWLKLLEKWGLVSRSPDPTDQRRTFIKLTESSSSKLEAYFSDREKAA